MLKLIEKSATPSRVLALFIISAVLAALIVSQAFGKIELKSDAVMDRMVYYSSGTLYNNLEAQGGHGRQAYLYLHLIDYLFIFPFYSFLSTLAFLLAKKARAFSSLALVPVFAGAFDLLENICVDISILAYPNKIGVLADMAGGFTFAKMTLISITLILIAVLLVRWGYHKNRV